MHTPSAALAWEFWRRHRTRLMGIAGLVLAFTVVYPKLCALAGFDPNNPDPLEEVAKSSALQSAAEPSLLRIGQVLSMLFLACGPAVTMFLTLLCVVWMFTYTELDQRTKDPMRFPGRIFTLPVSTSFLFWWLFLGGLAAMMVFYASWVYLIPQPRIKIFGMHQNCFGWMALMVLAQAIAWTLAAWPGTRMLILMATVFYFLGCIDSFNFFECPIVLPLGAALAFAGLQKMRHGQWQGLTWKWPLAVLAACTEWQGPKRFAPPAQAQVWFEWRRFAGTFCFITVAMALVPGVIRLLARIVFSLEPLSGDMMDGFTVFLVFLPLFIHFCVGASPARSDQSFLMVRPLTNGEMVMPMLKTAAISTAISWVAVLMALAVLNLLGDFHKVAQGVSPLPAVRVAIVLGLIFLTWRVAVVNLCFMLPGNRWIATMPVLLIIALGAGIVVFYQLEQYGGYWHPLSRILPGLLLFLVAVKFLLAFLSFRVSLQRRLFAPNDVVNYLTIWVVLVAALLGTLALIHPARESVFPLSLGVILLVPLARIGFCPIALACYRHS